jgi:hypothetical protein
MDSKTGQTGHIEHILFIFFPSMDLDLLSEGQKPVDLPDEPLPRVINQSVGNDRYFTHAVLQISGPFLSAPIRLSLKL